MNTPEEIKDSAKTYARKYCNVYDYTGNKDYESLEEAYISGAMENKEFWQGQMWQPIETVPKGYDHPYTKYEFGYPKRNSTFVLLGSAHHVGVGYAIIREDHDEDKEMVEFVDEVGEWIDATLTHWMPLPKSPL